MVKEKMQGKQHAYLCEACGFAYREQQWAAKCEQWCNQHHSCNMEITQHAIEQGAEDT